MQTDSPKQLQNQDSIAPFPSEILCIPKSKALLKDFEAAETVHLKKIAHNI